ncbi:hypothetical protein LCM02_03490 [Lutimonas saemankumensis]|uniref:hypothetical protein n=1 Tax=Lutimonas saemankumensis TaxID=483016 RepID=UPI001CD4E7E0|nr:hypothetical protein [Lutimonas saemankumensis]MCA0931502.1 hypothetical protein [Lutimonas saemankumensis]
MFFLIFVTPFVWSQKIELTGNGIEIATDGSNFPSTTDLTKYINVPPGNFEDHVFTIKNEEKKEKIEIVSITSSASEFVVVNNLFELEKKEEGSFLVKFQPFNTGLVSSQITITVKKKNKEKTYTFNISGSDTDQPDPADLMITQYYENNNQDFIEIKNLSEKNIKGKTYYLVHYGSKDKLTDAPKRGRHVEIKLLPNEVKVYKSFDLKGNDIVLISTRKDKDCFENRIDLIGKQNEFWGQSLSLSKGACASESPHKDFDPVNWVELSIQEVDDSSSNQNIHIGVYQEGPVIWDGSKWLENDIPDRTRTAIINGRYITDNGDIEACNLVVNAELNLRSAVQGSSETRSVILYGDLRIDEALGTFKLGDKMSLVMYDDEAEITGEIIKYERSTSLNSQFDFTYWSSSVAAARVEDVFSGVRPGRIYYFDQSRSTSSDPDNDPDGTFWNVWVPAAGEMKPGRGYASEASDTSDNRHLVSFRGQPNNGVIIEQIHFNDDDDLDNDFNMIGNPYPSAIDIDLFFDQNSTIIDPVIYLWTHSTPVSEQTGDYSFDDYATYNRTGGTGVGNGPVPSNNIGSGQGFLVRAMKSGEVKFNNAMRLKNKNDQFFKMRNVKHRNKIIEKDRIWLNLTTDQGGFNQLLIGFVEGATSEFDRGFDAIKNQKANKIGFYSTLDDHKLAIQGFETFSSGKVVQLGFDTRVENRNYTISIGNTEGKLKRAEIILTDHYLGLSHNLKEGDYVFSQKESGSFPGRFSISLKSQPIVVPIETMEENEIYIYNEGDIFSIESPIQVQTFLMYDIQGRELLKHHPNKRSFEVANSKSKKGEVLYLQIIGQDQTVRRKKIYKH